VRETASAERKGTPQPWQQRSGVPLALARRREGDRKPGAWLGDSRSARIGRGVL